MNWREETDEERADREAEWNAVYVRCRTCHFGSIETEFGEDQCPDCSSTMFVPVEPDYEAAAKCLWYQERYTDFRNHPSEQDEYRRRARLVVDAALGIGGDDE